MAQKIAVCVVAAVSALIVPAYAQYQIGQDAMCNGYLMAGEEYYERVIVVSEYERGVMYKVRLQNGQEAYCGVKWMRPVTGADAEWQAPVPYEHDPSLCSA